MLSDGHKNWSLAYGPRLCCSGIPENHLARTKLNPCRMQGWKLATHSLASRMPVNVDNRLLLLLKRTKSRAKTQEIGKIWNEAKKERMDALEEKFLTFLKWYLHLNTLKQTAWFSENVVTYIKKFFFLWLYKSLFFLCVPSTLSTSSYYVLFNISANYTALSRAQLQSEVEVPVSLGLSPIRQLFHIFFIFLFDVLTSSGFRWELVQLHKHNFRLALRKYLQQKSKWRCYEVWIRSLLALCEINM